MNNGFYCKALSHLLVDGEQVLGQGKRLDLFYCFSLTYYKCKVFVEISIKNLYNKLNARLTMSVAL